MLYRLGQLINWLGIIAFWGLLLVAMGFWNSNEAGVAVVFVVFGGVVWLASRALRYLFAGD